jgi:hypothetical protein
MRNREGGPSPEKIERIRIPDDDAHNWIATLHEGGFSDDEIDHIMSHLNQTYAEHRGIDIVEEEVKRLEAYMLTKYGRQLSEEQKVYLRQGIKIRFGLEDENDTKGV